jgi:hypothetical protein
MILTTSELIAALQQEVRIPFHFAGKVELRGDWFSRGRPELGAGGRIAIADDSRSATCQGSDFLFSG